MRRSRGRPDPTAPATPTSPQANTRQPHRSEGPGRGAGGRRQGLAGLRDDAPSHRSATMRHCCGGRRRVRRARAGFETTRPATHSDTSAAGVEGAGGSGGHGRASRSTAPSEARVRRSRGRPDPTAPATPTSPQATRTGRPPPTSTHSGRARRRPQPSGTTSNTRRKAAAHRHTQRFGPQNKTRGSPSGPPRVHATSSYSTPSRGRVFSAVAQPRPRRPGPR